MKKRTFTQPAPQADSPSKFIALTSADVMRVCELVKCLRGEELQDNFKKRAFEEGLVCTPPSICYGIPFPFLTLNARQDREEMVIDWFRVDQRKVPAGRFIGPESHQVVYLGINLDRIDELENCKVHVGLQRYTQEPAIITTCGVVQMDYQEAVSSNWHKAHYPSVSNFLKRTQKTLEILAEILSSHEAECCP